MEIHLSVIIYSPTLSTCYRKAPQQQHWCPAVAHTWDTHSAVPKVLGTSPCRVTDLGSAAVAASVSDAPGDVLSEFN